MAEPGREEVTPRRVDHRAVCLGRGRGRPRLRGRGKLVLTGEALHFRRALPGRRLVIPLDAVHSVEVVPTFTRRGLRYEAWGAGPLTLRVAWYDGTDDDLAGWQVEDAAGWREAIEGERRGRR